jgi:hypothetical protein
VFATIVLLSPDTSKTTAWPKGIDVAASITRPSIENVPSLPSVGVVDTCAAAHASTQSNPHPTNRLMAKRSRLNAIGQASSIT